MKRASVLIVEDEPLAALEIQECLERMGHEVPRIVDSADAVIGAVVSLRPDLVVMDIHLKSYTDGIDAARRLSLIHPAPLIFLSAYSDQEVRDRAASASPVAYLVKPLDENLFRESVTRALESGGTASRPGFPLAL